LKNKQPSQSPDLGHTTVKIPPCPDSWAIIAKEHQLGKQKGHDPRLGTWMFWATDRGQTQSDSNPREVDLTQFFLKALEGMHHCFSLWKGKNIQDLWNKIQNLLGIPE